MKNLTSEDEWQRRRAFTAAKAQGQADAQALLPPAGVEETRARASAQDRLAVFSLREQLSLQVTAHLEPRRRVT